MILRAIQCTWRLHRHPDHDEECESVLYSMRYRAQGWGSTSRSGSDVSVLLKGRATIEKAVSFFRFVVLVPSVQSHGDLGCSRAGSL